MEQTEKPYEKIWNELLAKIQKKYTLLYSDYRIYKFGIIEPLIVFPEVLKTIFFIRRGYKLELVFAVNPLRIQSLLKQRIQIERFIEEKSYREIILQEWKNDYDTSVKNASISKTFDIYHRVQAQIIGDIIALLNRDIRSELPIQEYHNLVLPKEFLDDLKEIIKNTNVVSLNQVDIVVSFVKDLNNGGGYSTIKLTNHNMIMAYIFDQLDKLFKNWNIPPLHILASNFGCFISSKSDDIMKIKHWGDARTKMANMSSRSEKTIVDHFLKKWSDYFKK